jgi:hypothetical protein
LIGVTANHVVDAFEGAKRKCSTVACLLRTSLLDLPRVIIDRDDKLDIATFKVTEEQLIQSEAIAIDCRSEWPPPAPRAGDALSLAGYPEAFKTPFPSYGGKFRAYANLTFVQAVTDQEIVVTHEPGRDARIIAAPELPDIGANLSGCSGGPVLLHIEQSGLERCFAVGSITFGPGELPGDQVREFDLIRLKRIHFIENSGLIQRPDPNQWLP